MSLQFTTWQWIITIAFCIISFSAGIIIMLSTDRQKVELWKYPFGLICSVYLTCMFFCMMGFLRKYQLDESHNTTIVTDDNVSTTFSTDNWIRTETMDSLPVGNKKLIPFADTSHLLVGSSLSNEEMVENKLDEIIAILRQIKNKK